jgi:hypothetical protein
VKGPAFSNIAFFISGHGFGHGVRQSALIDALPPQVGVTIFTSLPERFFREELRRPFRLIPCELDCGSLQPDAVDVDVPGTLARYLELESGRAAAVDRFAPMLEEIGTDLVIADAPPLAFPIAKAAGLPAWAIYNFTWLDIYRPYVEKHPAYRPMMARMEADLALADAHLRIYPAMESPAAAPVEEVGLLCKLGQPRRAEFAGMFGIDPDKKWCSVYLGEFGLRGAAWEGFGRFPDWEFLGLYPLSGAPANYKYINKDKSFHYADLTASCDLVLGKLGYGLVAGCLAMAKPVLFLGRRDFDEYPMLKRVVEERGLGREVSLEAFLRLDIGEELFDLASRRVRPMPITGKGRILEKMGISPSGSGI